MQLANFPVKNGNSYSVRGGSAMIALELDDMPPRQLTADNPDKFRTGVLGLYENGGLVKDWRVRITASGVVVCTDDDFYQALDLLASMTGS